VVRLQSFSFCLFTVFLALPLASAQQPVELEAKLKSKDIDALADRVREQGRAGRGALVFYKSTAACLKCHTAGADDDGDASNPPNPLGPDLATIGKKTTHAHIVESLLYPSRVIRKGYETHIVTDNDGRTRSGMLVRQDDQSVVLRDSTDLQNEIVIARSDIDEMSISRQSMMPEGLVATLKNEREFYDLANYLTAIARRGPEAVERYRPDSSVLATVDDTKNLDHAGILKSLDDEDFAAGKRIFMGHCKNCHGEDGNQPRLATARAFGNQKLKFGADPFKMFMTLSHGGGMMAPMTHLLAKERYQVVHFIREGLMKSSNPGYAKIDDAYLNSLPKGTRKGDFVYTESRDFGAVLGSQLRDEVQAGLHFRLPYETSVCYDLHRGRLASAWRGGFLDLSQTHHFRQRGERMPKEVGQKIPGLSAWQWQLGGSFDLPDENHEDKPKRGPVRNDWWQFHGHYLHGRRAVLSYAVHGRDVLETIDAQKQDELVTLEHTLSSSVLEPKNPCLSKRDQPRSRS